MKKQFYKKKKQLNIFGLKIKYKVKDPFVGFFQGILCLNQKYADKKIAKFKLKKKPIIKNMVLSMTSYPERMKDVHYAIFSILNQTIRPERFILWLAQEEFPNDEKDIPQNVLQFKKFGLEIKFTDAIRSFKKIVPALREFPDSILVSADDDIFYPETWLESMYKSYQKDPTKIYAHRLHEVKIENNAICPYSEWTKCTNSKEISYLNFPTSVAGILYPPKVFTSEAINIDRFRELCPNQDDVWVWAMAILNQKTFITPINSINNNLIYINPERELGINDETTLAKVNVISGENDKQISDTILYYNLLGVLTNEK